MDNDYAADSPHSSSATPGVEEFLARRASAYQAFYEHMPLRASPAAVRPTLRCR